jgi:hypothetical protein
VPGEGEIVLRFVPLPDDVPVGVRVRALLKTALRRDRLRCVGQTLPPEPPDAGHQPAQAGRSPTQEGGGPA